MKQKSTSQDMVEVFEDMLYERASRGFRPVLYVSSFTDLECNMLMLLDRSSDRILEDEFAPTDSRWGYQAIMN